MIVLHVNILHSVSKIQDDPGTQRKMICESLIWWNRLVMQPVTFQRTNEMEIPWLPCHVPFDWTTTALLHKTMQSRISKTSSCSSFSKSPPASNRSVLDPFHNIRTTIFPIVSIPSCRSPIRPKPSTASRRRRIEPRELFRFHRPNLCLRQTDWNHKHHQSLVMVHGPYPADSLTGTAEKQRQRRQEPPKRQK